jgi:predicted nuclease of predicted toxin-antitoxin system
MPLPHDRWNAPERLLGFSSAEDEDIWSHAKSNDFVIISKDEDFADLCILDSEPASVIWLRIRNCSERALLSWFESVLPNIEKALARGDRLIEVV